MADGSTPRVHPPSGVRFLESWRGWSTTTCFRYDEAGMNVSVRYTKPRTGHVSVYVFPRRDTFLTTLFHHIIADMSASVGGARIGGERDVAFARPGGLPLRGRMAWVRGVAPASPGEVLNAAFLVEAGTWVVKVRETTKERSPDRDGFLDAWWSASGLLEAPCAPASVED